MFASYILLAYMDRIITVILQAFDSYKVSTDEKGHF